MIVMAAINALFGVSIIILWMKLQEMQLKINRIEADIMMKKAKEKDNG